MSLKRVVDTRFWNQVDVMERYSSQDKLFALYLMTCPRSTQLGIYSLPKRVIAFDMSLDDAQVGQLLARFQDDYQVIAYSDQTQEVAILDFLTYSLVKGGQPVERLLRNQAEDVRDSQLLVKVFQHLASYYEHSHRLIDQLSQEVLATELKRRQELGHEGEGVTSLSQGMQLGSLSQETHEASTRLGSSDNHNQNPNQKDNQIHKENQSHNHKQNQNHNSASKLDPDSDGKLDARELGESSAKEVVRGWAASSATSSSTPVSGSALGTASSALTSSQALGTSSSATSTQPFSQAISLPDQSLSQTLARAQSLTSKPGQSQAGISQQTMDQFVRVERDMAKLRPFYERYFGPMTGAESLQFRNWLAKIGYWPVIEAIEQAHRRQAKKPFAYISTICQQASKA
ncbi:hypothetical protein MK526_05915 [Abiotrophia defectiva]|uniref:hypothetical protein n=1 Tax=Abiotrophia defectiva TaxID=46125 RepID=UPI0022831FB4|nr:hypothetical protein [Abiotrophia defectiva]MCY7225283.1 hypothetical protein [Abiotrophia defectiva]